MAIRVDGRDEAAFLGFGFVSAQLQAAAGMLLRRSLAKTQKSSLRPATLFLETLSALASGTTRQLLPNKTVGQSLGASPEGPEEQKIRPVGRCTRNTRTDS
jgi:hypothetical protein